MLGFEESAIRNSRDSVCLLVYKQMVTEIHVVGDGIVGQAALTGSHQWILHNAHYGSVAKAMAAMNHQFSAGIQTIAIIPVLPHGVLQLGSTQMVIENKGFINHVKSLFGEIGTVCSTLVPDSSQNPLDQNILQNASIEASSSLSQSGDSSTYINRFLSGSLDKSHNQLLQSPYSRSVSQSSCSIFRHPYGSMPANSSNMSSTTATRTMMPLGDHARPTIHPVDEPICHQSQLQREHVGTQSVISNPIVSPIENAERDSSSASLHLQFPSGSTSGGQTMLEEQLLSISGSQEFAKKYWPKVDDYETRQQTLTGSQATNIVDDLRQCSSFPVCTMSVECQRLSSSSKEVPKMLDPTDLSKNTEILPIDSELMPSTSIQKSGKIPTEGQQRNDYNIFQTLLESTQFEEQQSRHELLLHTPLDSSWQSSIIPVQERKTSVSSVSGENHASASNSPNITGIDNSMPLEILNMEGSLSPLLFTSGDDLFDLLDVHNKSGGFHGCLDDVFVQGTSANVHEMSSDVSTCITQMDKGTLFDTSKEKTCNEEKYCNGLFSQASPDQLLDAIVAQINSAAKHNLDDDVSCKTSLTKNCRSTVQTSSATSDWLASSGQMNGKCSGISSMLVKSETAGSNSAISACAMEKNGECSQKDGVYKSKISLWDEKDQNVEYGSISAAHGKRIDEAGKLNKKRSRSGENPRPRPKDRQMIQDRVKELREIVPNGAKCSIDALLEKTIKHMLFLQSVTKHADKLKDVGEPKIVSKEGGLLLKDNFEGGATWAFEIGTQSMICPIIVEDLNVPRQMLVEMLCEEQGLFLEIADLIRGLGLTILKGVLEARKDKVWARFAVEANRDVTRMEIFLSLVRLLEPNGGSSTVPQGPQGVECVNTQHNMFHPFSLHAAGMSDCL